MNSVVWQRKVDSAARELRSRSRSLLLKNDVTWSTRPHKKLPDSLVFQFINIMLAPFCREGFSLYGEIVFSNAKSINSGIKELKQKRRINIFFPFFPFNSS